MKQVAVLLSILALSQVVSASDKIICANENAVETYTTAKLTDFGILPNGLSVELADRVANSVCDFKGVYQESWSATCFEKKIVDGLPTGGYISGLQLAGFEHGSLTVTDVKTLNCQGL